MVHWHNKQSIITSRQPQFLLNIGTGNKQYTNDGLIYIDSIYTYYYYGTV